MNKCFKRIGCVNDGKYVHFCKFKGLSDENINSITASNYSLILKLNYLNAKIRVNCNSSCLKQDQSNTYTHGATINIYVVHKLNPSLNKFDPTLENCLFGAVKLTKNADIGKCKYLGYGIGFESKGKFLFPDGSFPQNGIIFGADMSSSAHVNTRKKIYFHYWLRPYTRIR